MFRRVLDAQTRDTAADTYRENQAKVAADKANIDRLNALEALKLLRAPFDGIVTARHVDLLPGAYAEITFKFTDDSRFLTIPENTLLFRREGPAVGVVHPDGKVELRKITINRDFGDELEISQGLSTSDQVILNPSDSLTDGISVRITEPSALQASST